MALETGTTIDELVATNPTASDPAGQGDDHLRLIKAVLKNSFPQVGGIFGQCRIMNSSQTISSVYNTSLIVVGVTSTLTLPPSASITSGWYVDLQTAIGGTATIQTQGSQSINGAASLSIPAKHMARIHFTGGNTWRAAIWPSAEDGFPAFENVQVNGTLSVSGVATFKSGVSVSGAAVLSGNLTIGGDIIGGVTISGAAVLQGNLTVNGNTTLSTVTALGAATFKSGISISGAAALTGGLTVGGAMTVSAATVLQSTLSVAGAATISGATALLGSLSIAGNIVSTVTISGATVLQSTLTVNGAATISGALTLTAGQIAFPATQNPSAGANVLDDYEEGTWTPSLTMQTPGNLSVAYSNRVGAYTKIGNAVHVMASIQTSTWTHTTASGEFRVTGFPFTSNSDAVYNALSIAIAQNIVGSSNYTLGLSINGGLTYANTYFFNSGAIVAPATAVAANVATGNQIIYGFGGTYRSA